MFADTRGHGTESYHKSLIDIEGEAAREIERSTQLRIEAVRLRERLADLTPDHWNWPSLPDMPSKVAHLKDDGDNASERGSSARDQQGIEEAVEAAATQWQQCEDFARFLSERYPLGVDPVPDAERYVRFSLSFSQEQWELVKAYRVAQGGTISLPARTPFANAPEYELPSAAMLARALFGFGAQYTMQAWQAVGVFLQYQYGYSAAEWEDVEDFINAQEEKIPL